MELNKFYQLRITGKGCITMGTSFYALLELAIY